MTPIRFIIFCIDIYIYILKMEVKGNDPEYTSIINNFPFYQAVTDHRRNLPLLIDKHRLDGDTDDMKILRHDLASNFAEIDKYEKKTDPESKIIILFNKEQKRKIFKISKGVLKEDDITGYMEEYRKMLFGAYRQFGEHNGQPLRLDDINKMSHKYAKDAIIYPDPIYGVFAYIQKKIIVDILENKSFARLMVFEEEIKTINRYSYNMLLGSAVYTEFKKNIAADIKKNELKMYEFYMSCVGGTDRSEVNDDIGQTNTLFENQTMILEIRAYQIKIHYIIFIIVSQIYDCIKSKTQKDIMTSLASTSYNYHNDPVLNDKVYNIILPFLIEINKISSPPTAAGRIRLTGHINQLITEINVFLKEYSKSLLNKIKEKYTPSIQDLTRYQSGGELKDEDIKKRDNYCKNYNLYLALYTHRYFILFEQHITDMIENKLYNYIKYLKDTGKCLFNTVTDDKLLKIYMNYHNNVDPHVSLNEESIEKILRYINGDDKKQQARQQLEEYKQTIDWNDIVCQDFLKKKEKFNVADHTDKKLYWGEIINNESLSRVMWICNFVTPDIISLNDANYDQTKIDELYFGPNMKPDNARKRENNKVCDIVSHVLIDGKKQHFVYGLDNDLLPYMFCWSKYMVQPFPDINIWKICDLSQWSLTTNHLLNYVATKRDPQQLLYTRDLIKPLVPLHFYDHLPDQVDKVLENIKKKLVYTGIIIIPTNSWVSPGGPKKKVILFIFWNKIGNRLHVCDYNGHTLYTSTVLYVPFVTYDELLQLYKTYKLDYFKLKNEFYLVRKDTDLIEDETVSKVKVCVKEVDAGSHKHRSDLLFGKDCDDVKFLATD